jgi:ABC-2 type transport system permease protein
MSRTMAVVRREFTEYVRSRSFLIGTVLGPLLMIGLFAAQYLMVTRAGGGTHSVVVIDATGSGLGSGVVEALADPRPSPSRGTMQPNTYEATLETIGAAQLDAARAALAERVVARDLDGYLILPPDLDEAGMVRYEGENASSGSVISDMRTSVQRAVQLQRLAEAGIELADIERAMQPIAIDAVKTGGRGAGGSAQAAMFLALAMGFVTYLVVLLYGAAVMNGVVEEKRDRVYELILSSIRAQQLMYGKIIGIGGAGLLQIGIWISVAALLLTQGATIAGALGLGEEAQAAIATAEFLPSVPLSVAVVLLLFFAGGFFVYLTLYAVIGAMSTTPQEAQQIAFPIILPLILGVFMLMPALDNPDGGLAVAGSMIPFTAPIIMPARHAMVGVPVVELAMAFAGLLAFGWAVTWVGAKIYRIGIFATGKRVGFRETIRWLREV